MKKAFTIVELLVAMGLFGMLLAASGVIFATAVNAHRTAEATAEIAQNLAAITDQLNTDFKGLRKEGEIFVVWVAAPVLDDRGVPIDDDGDGNPDRYERFDRLLFFADGDFQSYRQWFVDTPSGPLSTVLTGNLARICYMLARDADGIPPQQQEPASRILARTQHILTSETIVDPCGVSLPFPDLATFDASVFAVDNFIYEYDNTTTLQGWKTIDPCNKVDMLSTIGGVNVTTAEISNGGTPVSPSEPATIHMLLCQGVGQFSVQGWYEDPLQQRWVPEIDPDDDGILDDSDFFTVGTPPQIDPCSVPLLVYPYGPYASPSIIYDWSKIDESYFNEIPGLGRALKFTFTLYDSRGVFPEGKTFTHIVYLDD